MSWTNSTKNSTSYSNPTKNTLATYNIVVGNPIGLLLALTYAEASTDGLTYTTPTKNSTSYTNITKH